DFHVTGVQTCALPIFESLQRAAQVSLEWFEGTERFWGTHPLQFAFNLLTRSLRVTHDNLRVRDPDFVARVDAWFAEQAEMQVGEIGRASCRERAESSA